MPAIIAAEPAPDLSAMHPFPPIHPRIRLLACSLAALLLTLPGPQAAAQSDQRSWNLGIALGHGARNNPLLDGDSIDINAVIDFSWYGERFFFDNGDFGYTLTTANNWSVNLVATVNNERNFYNYLSGRSLGLDRLLGDRLGGLSSNGVSVQPELTATGAKPGGDKVSLPASFVPEPLNQATELPDRDFALNGGFEFLYISPWGDIQAQVLNDISSTHKGQEAWLSWSRPWYTRRNEFTLTLGLEWKSADLISYYYGVRRDEALPGRPFYESGAGANTFVRLAARHAFSRHWYLVGMVEREFLSSAIRNSPIVDENAVDTFFAGLFYRF